MKEVKFKRFRTKATAPKRETVYSAGYNIFSAEKVTIGLHCIAIASTDISMKFDRKLVAKICSRSSLSARSIETGAGVVGSGYRGIIYFVLHNLLFEEATANIGHEIFQIVFEKFSLSILKEFFDLKR